MNRQGNRRTTKEGSSDLKFQNFALLKNRSWPRLSSATGGDHRAGEPPDHERKFAAILDGMKGHSDDDYEDLDLQMVEAWQSMQISPAPPIKESEYADTRYFKGVVDAPLPSNAKTSLPTGVQTWSLQERLDGVQKPIPRDVRSQQVTGDKSIKKNKTPFPPPRPPAALLRKPQPLPREPKSCRSLPPRGPSSSFMVRSPSVQDRDPKGSWQPSPPQRCRPPACMGPRGDLPPCDNTGWRKPLPARPGEETAQKEWYVGEHSRRAAEAALMQENKDGTFLVRDCSTKSKAEPYVLVVFYGNKVYNVKIRFLEGNQQFALGTGLRGDEKFDSVEEIIEHYKYFPIILIDGKDKTGSHREQCYLTQPLPRARHLSPP
ncbi:cytokine-dependent hematopoietic cell linker [Otolemur garnettii]|uniref:cytokine-dependent hematopoietic cell linker n=1 Tax=Otolemur garnettii TaxID=30611 RepID=UPI000C7EA1CA|nr:cytokine-dependent hematopoietic cell linker [Otolemur garnettii]